MLYGIAGLNVRMDPAGPLLAGRAENYLSPDQSRKADITLSVPEYVIEDYNKTAPGLTRDECEYLVTGTAFYHRLITHNGLMLHSSAVALDGKAYLFSADCGVGKSTHTALWLREFPGSFIINDDKPALRRINGRFLCCGTPFSGKNDISRNVMLPLAGIAFVRRSQGNSVSPLPVKRSLPLFMEQTLRLFGAEHADLFLSLLSDLLSEVPVYELCCNTDPEAAHVAYNSMSIQ